MKGKFKSIIISASVVAIITIILLIIMERIITQTKHELLEEKFRTTSEMIDIRCNEVESTAFDWEQCYDEYIERLCFFIHEIDSIPFTFGVVYDQDLNILSERIFHVAISDDPLDIYFDSEMLSLIKNEAFGVKDMKYPVKLETGSIKHRSMRIYFRRIPQLNDNYIIICIAQPFDNSLIELPSHYMKLIYTVIGIIGLSISLFIVMFFRYFFFGKRFPFNSMDD